ncbi:MAG: hypothetical protein FJW61_02465 [Actinobacteria bacterium]|nr:hypothetical protein [Actinomycetota bacterium]
MNYKIIDTHLHLGPYGPLYVPSNSEDNVINLLKKFNVIKAICSHHLGFVSVENGIEGLFKVLGKYKNFLYGYLVFNPNFSKISLEIIKKYIGYKNIIGVKIHPSWHQCYPNDLKYNDLWNIAEEKNFPILSHSWSTSVGNPIQRFSNPLLFKNVVKNHPNLKLILAHAGGRGEYFYKVMNLLEENENLYVDFAGDVFFRGLLKEFVSNVGSGRILFGTDLPWTDVRYHIANVLYADINERHKKNILSLNALKLFNIEV